MSNLTDAYKQLRYATRNDIEYGECLVLLYNAKTDEVVKIPILQLADYIADDNLRSTIG